MGGRGDTRQKSQSAYKMADALSCGKWRGGEVGEPGWSSFVPWVASEQTRRRAQVSPVHSWGESLGHGKGRHRPRGRGVLLGCRAAGGRWLRGWVGRGQSREVHVQRRVGQGGGGDVADSGPLLGAVWRQSQ